MSDSILIVGSSSLGSLESSYERAFRRLGWTTRIWDPIATLHRMARGARFGRLFSSFVHVEVWSNKANGELARLADEYEPTLILIIGTSGVRGGTLAQIKVKSPAILIYCVYPDSPHNLDSNRIHCLPFCDRVTTSSPAWVSAFEKLGANRVAYLPFAADPELHNSASTNGAGSRAVSDIAFIGTWRPDREIFLEHLADFDLRLWGSNYWKRRTRPGSPLPARWGGRSIVGDEFVRVCQESKIMLNMLDPITWPGPNMRTFELPASRAFSLATRTAAVTNLFREGETIECFDTPNEAREKIQFYLHHDSERKRIIEASYHFVVEGGHTYLDRAKTLSEWVAADQLPPDV